MWRYRARSWRYSSWDAGQCCHVNALAAAVALGNAHPHHMSTAATVVGLVLLVVGLPAFYFLIRWAIRRDRRAGRPLNKVEQYMQRKGRWKDGQYH